MLHVAASAGTGIVIAQTNGNATLLGDCSFVIALPSRGRSRRAAFLKGVLQQRHEAERHKGASRHPMRAERHGDDAKRRTMYRNPQAPGQPQRLSGFGGVRAYRGGGELGRPLSIGRRSFDEGVAKVISGQAQHWRRDEIVKRY